MASARIIPIIINVQPGGGGAAVVTQIASAFRQLDQDASSAGSRGLPAAERGMTSAFVAAELLHDGLHKLFDFMKEAIVDTTLFAGRTEELTIALHQLAAANNISTDSIDSQLKGLLNLNIARQEATQILSQMIGANLDLSKATQLARVAQDAAVISGKNSSEAFVDLTNAILLGRTEAFRAAGVFISVEEVLTKGAKALGVNKDALTEFQRTQILTSAVTGEFGDRLKGTYEAAMGSASKQMRSLVRIHDDAKESVGALFQGPFMLGVKVTGELLKLIAAYPGTFAALTVAVLALTASLVFYNTELIPSLIAKSAGLVEAFQSLVFWTINWRVALTDVQVATSLIASWAAVAIALGVVVFALANVNNAAETANKITLEQIESQKTAFESSRQLADAAAGVASAQAGSVDRHQKLNAVMGQLDPTTRAYIAALKDEKDQVQVVNEKLEKNAQLNRAVQEATLTNLGRGILDQIDQITAKDREVQQITQHLNEMRAQFVKAGETPINSANYVIGGGGENAARAQAERDIANYSQGLVTAQDELKKLDDALLDNDGKLKAAAEALGLNRDQLIDFANKAGLSRESMARLQQEFDRVTPKINETTNAVLKQVSALENLKNVQNSFKLRDEQIDAKTINIVRDAKNAGELRRKVQEARQADPALNQAILDKQRTDANKRALDSIVSTSAGGGHGSKPVDEVKDVSRAVQKLKQDIAALQAGGGKLFNLQVERADLEATKHEYEEIFKLRHQLNEAVGAAIPVEETARQAALRDLQRHLSTKQEITKIGEQDLDNAERVKVLAAQVNEANLTAAAGDARHVAAMQTLIDLKRKQLDISVQVTDAEAETKAIQEWLIAVASGRPVLGGNKNGSGEYAESIEQQAKLFEQSTAVFTKNAVVANHQEIARQKELTGNYYAEGTLRQRIVQEEGTARIKTSNDASEEIRRIEERLSHALISNDLALELARQRAAEQRRKDVQAIGIDVQLVIDQLARLAGGDKQETSIASDNYLKSFYSSMVGVRQELIAIKGLGGINAIFGSAEFQQSLKEKFDLGQLHTVIDLGTQIAQSQYNVAHAAETSSLRYQLAWQKAYEDVASASQRAMEARAVDEVKLAHQMDVDVNRIDDGLVHFLAEQKTLQQTFQDVRTNTVKTFFDGIDSAIDKVIKKGSLLSNTLGQLSKDLIHLFASQYLQRLLGIGPGSGSGGQRSAGGGFNPLSLLFGGGGGGSNAVFSGGSGSTTSGGSSIFNGGSSSTGTGPGANMLRSLFSGSSAPSFAGGIPGLGSEITAPPSLSGQGSLAQIAAIAQGNPAGASTGGGAAASGFSLEGLGAMAPLLAAALGVGIGSSFGRGVSPLASILGGVGLGAVGLVAGSAIPALLAGTFAGLTALGAATLGIGAAVAIAAYIIGKNKQRQAEEKVRNTASTDTLTAIYQLLRSAQHGDLTLAEATTQFEQIHQQYLTSIGGIKDSKTKRNALLWWDYVAGTAKDPGGATKAIWPDIAAAAKAGEAAKAFTSTFVPTFATGGLVPYRGGMMTTIAVRPGERIDDVGMRASYIVPGIDYGRDSVLLPATPGSAVRTRQQQVRIPGFSGGSNAPSVASNNNSGAPVINIEIACEVNSEGIVVKGVKTPAGSNAVVNVNRAHVQKTGRGGLAGDIELTLTQRN